MSGWFSVVKQEIIYFLFMSIFYVTYTSIEGSPALEGYQLNEKRSQLRSKNAYVLDSVHVFIQS